MSSLHTRLHQRLLMFRRRPKAPSFFALEGSEGPVFHALHSRFHAWMPGDDLRVPVDLVRPAARAMLDARDEARDEVLQRLPAVGGWAQFERRLDHGQEP